MGFDELRRDRRDESRKSVERRRDDSRREAQ
jgi:hypothetical protein